MTAKKIRDEHKIPHAEAERCISEIANKVLTNVGRVVHASLDMHTNKLYQAVLSASKGNLINVAQLTGAVGQQSVDGQRIFVDDPQHSFGHSSSMSSNGFVSHSYFEGLTSVEFFFHSMAGREGLIDTAVKTANTGYLQRRLMKAMETLTISYDGTVRNAKQNIIQFQYGGDGFDATYIVRQSVPCLFEPLDVVKTRFSSDEWIMFQPCLVSMRQKRLLASQGNIVDDLIYAPANVKEIILQMCYPGNCDDAPSYSKKLENLINDLCHTQWSVLTGLEILLRWHFRIEAMRGFSSCSISKALDEVERRVKYAYVNPGEAVGALSAQSISEPLTQLTLNTFHMAGVKAKNVTLGASHQRTYRCDQEYENAQCCAWSSNRNFPMLVN